MQNRLYAIGGYNGQERLNTVEVFDAVTKRWSKVAAMNCKRSAVRREEPGQVLMFVVDRLELLPWGTTSTFVEGSMVSPVSIL